MKRSRIVAACAALLLTTSVAVGDLTADVSAAPDTQGRRDAWTRPFDADSIWNTPIGSNARYVDAGYPTHSANAIDVAHFATTDDSDPVVDVRRPFHWRDRCNDRASTAYSQIVLPEDFVIPDAVEMSPGRWKTPNNQSVILQPDGRTLANMGGTCRDQIGDDVFANNARVRSDLYGDGLEGAHGASRLPSIGGAIRPGELTDDDPIAHVLDLVLFTEYAATTKGECFRWPAKRCDAYGDWTHASNRGRYRGGVPEMQMGALLALPPNVTPASLGIETEAGRKIFDALQDWGGYWTEDSAWSANYLTADSSAERDIAVFHTTAVRGEFGRMVGALHVVDNNRADNIGGGGTPRAPVHVNEFTSDDAPTPTPSTTTPPTTTPSTTSPPTTTPPTTTPPVTVPPTTTPPATTPPATTPPTTTPPLTTPPTTTHPATTTPTTTPPAVGRRGTLPPTSRGDKFADWFGRSWLGKDWKQHGDTVLGIEKKSIRVQGGAGDGWLLRDAESADGSISADIVPTANTSLGLVARGDGSDGVVGEVEVVDGSVEMSLWTLHAGNRVQRASFSVRVAHGKPLRVSLTADGHEVTFEVDGTSRTVALDHDTAAGLHGNHGWGMYADGDIDRGAGHIDRVLYKP